MNDAPLDPGRVRRAFLEAPPRVPFLKTREGRLIAGLGILCLLACVALFLQYRKTQAAIERASAQRLLEQEQARAAVPLEERLAQKRAELATAYEGAFADTANEDGFVETAGYAKLIELLASMSPEEATSKAKDSYLDYSTASLQPDLVRGDFVRVRGLIAGIFAVKLERTVHDITDVWRGTVTQPDGSEAVVFDFVGELPEFEKRRTVVEVDGLMYRIARYETRDRDMKSAPYLLARNIRVLGDTAPSDGSTKFWVTIMGIVAIIGYLMLRSAWRSRTRRGDHPTRFKVMFQERLRARREQRP